MKKINKKTKAALIISGIVLIGCVGFIFFKKPNRNMEMNNENFSQRTATVKRGSLISSLSSSGTVEPKDTYSITSLVEGEILSANFEEGDTVEKGEVLYVIDSSSMESEIESSNKSLEKALKEYQDSVDEYEKAKSKYNSNTYKSTQTGYIKKLNIAPGDKISSNAEIATLYDNSVMTIKIPFLSTEAINIQAGETAYLTLVDTDEMINGIVKYVSDYEDTLTGGRLVKYVTIEVNNPGGLTESHVASATIKEYTGCEEGNFEATKDKSIRADISGNIEVENVLVNEGCYITNGTPLFSMDSKSVEDVLESYRNAVDTAEEKADSAQNKLDSIMDTYENYTITAPISGQVIRKNSKAGDNVSKSSGNSSIMATIYDLSQMTFEMSIDELDIQNIKVGQKVEVTADAFEDEIFNGTVTSISLESTYSNGVTNYPVVITLDETGDLLPGMNVNATIILNETDDTLMIPVDALMRGNKVYVEDNTITEAKGNVPAGFREVIVETGLANDEYVEILSGLSEGDKVYISESSASTNSMFPMGMQQGGMPGGDMSRMPSGGNFGGGPSGGRQGGM